MHHARAADHKDPARTAKKRTVSRALQVENGRDVNGPTGEFLTPR